MCRVSSTVSMWQRVWMFFLFFAAFGTNSIQAQIFEDFGFRTGSYTEGGYAKYTYAIEWTVRQNRREVGIGWTYKEGVVTTGMTCSISGDWKSSRNVAGSALQGGTAIPLSSRNALGEHRFTATCTDANNNTESRTATLMVEKGYEILDFYVDAASQPVQAGSDITFRWNISPDNLRCSVTGPKYHFVPFPSPPEQGIKAANTKDAKSAFTYGEEWADWALHVPKETGEYEYSLTCQEPIPIPGVGENSVNKTLKVNVVAAKTNSNTPAFDLFWLSSTRITTAQSTTLNWAVSNADTCTASGAWSGVKDASGTTTLSNLVPGNYDYTLICQNAAGTIAKTVALVVTEPAAQITRFEFIGTRKNAQGEHTLQNGESASLRWAASHAAICEISGPGWSGTQPTTTAGITLVDVVINTVGEHDFTLTCQSAEGGSADSQTLTLIVLPADEITAFYIDTAASTLKPDGQLTLRWETLPTDLTCQVRTTGADWPQKAPGLIEFKLPRDYGDYLYELRCGEKPVTQTLAVKLEDIAPPATNLSGQYFGMHTQIMALGDQPPSAFLEAGGIGNMLRIDGSGRHYNVLGENITEAYWLWDFDKGQIYLGGSNLRALDLFLPPYRLYSPDRMRRENADGTPAQYLPDADPPLSEQIGTFEDRGNGRYAVKFFQPTHLLSFGGLSFSAHGVVDGYPPKPGWQSAHYHAGRTPRRQNLV